MCSLRALPEFESLKAERMATASEDELRLALRGLSTGRQPSLWQALAGYTGRVLWVTGREDAKFVAIGRELMERVGDKGGRWTLCEMEGCGHAVHVEKAEDLVEVLLDWIPKEAM
jgi:2-succinyl-6-hydroxy-2,4-cyclohexadiene-1-carboxylate synthase